jgi:hypothetical protein
VERRSGWCRVRDAFADYTPSGVVNALSQSDVTLMQALGWTKEPQPPPPGTSSDMIMCDNASCNYEIYDIGNDVLLVGHP